MSIGALALRMSLTRELRGKTIAGNAVFDSTIAPIDEFSAEGDAPFISIAVEDQKYTDIGGKDLSTATRRLDLVVEVASGQAAHIQTDEGLISGVNLCQTDASKEMTIDLICRQIERSLINPSSSAWGSLLASLLLAIVEVNVRRGIKAEGGSRLAFRQLVFTVDLIAEPRLGAEPAHVWADFMAAVEADPETSILGPAIRAVIVGDAVPAHLIDWVATGMRPDAADKLRLLGASGDFDEGATLESTSFNIFPALKEGVSREVSNEGAKID